MLKKQFGRLHQKVIHQAERVFGERRKLYLKRDFLNSLVQKGEDEQILIGATRVLSRLREIYTDCGVEAVWEIIAR